MRSLFRSTLFSLILILNFLFSGNAYSDNHNIYEILDLIKKDLKTLERAVYSGSIEIEGNSNNESVLNLDNHSEDVLTRHLLNGMVVFTGSKGCKIGTSIPIRYSEDHRESIGTLNM